VSTPLEALELLRAALEGVAVSLSAGNAVAAAEAVTRATAICEALGAGGIRLPSDQLAQLTELHDRCRATASLLQQQMEAAQQALSVSRKAKSAYASSGG
jgi:hypothetical protein